MLLDRVGFISVTFVLATLIACTSVTELEEPNEGLNLDDNPVGSSYFKTDVDKSIQPDRIETGSDNSHQLPTNGELPSVPVRENDICFGAKEINVVEVISANIIEAECLEREIKVKYVGIDTNNDNIEQFNRAKSLNEFLVGGHHIDLDFYGSVSEGGFEVFIAEAFRSGESVNIRLLESGLVGLHEFPPNFPRASLFVDALEEAENRKSGNWHGRIMQNKENQDNISTPSMGCGTLPCQIKN